VVSSILSIAKLPFTLVKSKVTLYNIDVSVSVGSINISKYPSVPGAILPFFTLSEPTILTEFTTKFSPLFISVPLINTFHFAIFVFVFIIFLLSNSPYVSLIIYIVINTKINDTTTKIFLFFIFLFFDYFYFFFLFYYFFFIFFRFLFWFFIFIIIF